MKTTGLCTPRQSEHQFEMNTFVPVESLCGTAPEEDGFIYADSRVAPFVLGGLLHPDENCGEYYRLDASAKEIYSDANRSLAACTPGGTVRFATDAKEIALRITLRAGCFGMHHFCDRGVYGIDVYIGTGTARRYTGKIMQTFAENHDVNRGTVSVDGEDRFNEVMIELPLYAGIETLKIGLKPGELVGAPTPRSTGAVAFYGSSITQGGCVSRPGNSYCNIICRALDADCCNYGFSGSAMGETEVASHIDSRDLACFVMDYDFNSLSCETLRATHEPFFKIIRAAQPTLPVVFVTHPFYSEPTENDLARIAIIRETYENALAAGDKNIRFVNSGEFFTSDMRDLYAVDNLHPNDLGQFSMACEILPAVRGLLGK